MPFGPIAQGMSPGELGIYLQARRDREELLRQQRIDAIRWEGAQEYDTLVRSGVAAPEAMRRSASKLFYNDPAALARAATDLSQQPGQIFEQGGRQFIQDPNGRIRAVPQRWTGSTTVMGPNNQIYKVPLSPEELGAAPRVSVPPTAPDVVPLAPGQGSMIIQPSGAGTRIPPAPTEFVQVADPETGTIRKVTRGEWILEQAQLKAKDLLDQYRANEAEIKAGEKKRVWDWIPGVETYAQSNARIKEQLKGYDLDELGNPIPGSRLDKAIQTTVQTTVPVAPAAPTGPPLYPVPSLQMAPPAQPSRPFIPSMPARTLPRPGNIFAPPTGISGAQPTNRPPPPKVKLGTNEVLRFYPPWGKWVIIDTKANQYLRDATQP